MDTFAGFDWDDGNRAKCQKHGVSIEEIESVFQRPIVILPDTAHSLSERRLRAVGQAQDGRHVFVVFTIRGGGSGRLIRPISARHMHRKEIRSYEEENPDVSNR